METTKNHKQDIAIARIETIVKETAKNVDTLITIVRGDNGEGLVTKVAKNSQSISRLWWLIPILITVGTTAVSYAVK